MTTVAVTTTTSSRLDRSIELSPAVKVQEFEISAKTIAYCNAALDRSRFFSRVKNNTISPALMQYAFLQYFFWRDRLHQWFGLCILKAESCTDPEQELTLLSLADHLFTDLQDEHNQMYAQFLNELGVSDADISTCQRSKATAAYERSFFDDFGYETHNFYEAIAALSGRELCASIRNNLLLHCYFDANQIDRPAWLSLHAELEVEHFHDAIRPVLIHHAENPAKIANLAQSIERGIDRHMQYFEELLCEYERLG